METGKVKLKNDQIRGILYFICNVLLILPILLQYFELSKFAFSMVFLIALLIYVVSFTGQGKSVLEILPWFIICDAAIIIFYMTSIFSFKEAGLSITDFLLYSFEKAGVLLGLALAVYFLSYFGKHPFAISVNFLSIFFFGGICTLLLTIESGLHNYFYDLLEMEPWNMQIFWDGGKAIFMFYIQAGIFWFGIVALISMVKKDLILKLQIYTAIFVGCWILVIAYGMLDIYKIATQWQSRLNVTWRWLRFLKILIPFFIVYCYTFAVEIHRKEKGILNLDVLVLNYFLHIFILYYLQVHLYFPGSWIMAPIFMGSMLFLIKNIPGTESKEMEVDVNFLYMTYILQLLTGIILVFIYFNLWFNTVLLLFTIYILLNAYKNWENRYVGLLVFTAVWMQSITWVLQFKFHISTIIMITMIWLVSMAVFLVLTWPNPNDWNTPRSVRIASFVAFLFLNFIFCRSYGSDIRLYKYDGKLGVVVEAKGRKNEIKKATIYWTNAFGELIAEPTDFTDRGEIESDTNSVCANIVVEDKNGIVSKRKGWFLLN